MLDFYRQQLTRVENELQKLYSDRPHSSIETEGSYKIRIDKLKGERVEFLKNIQEEETMQKALSPIGIELNETHMPLVVEKLQKGLPLNSFRTDFAEEKFNLSFLLDNFVGEHLLKVKGADTYRIEFDPKNHINSLFEDILFDKSKDENRKFVSKLGILTKIHIKEVRDDKVAFQNWERNVIVSAITLSLAKEYDIEKINLLIDFINDREPFVWKKALVGLFLCLQQSKHESKLKKDKSLEAKLQNLRTQPDVQYALIKIGEAFDIKEKDIEDMMKFAEITKLQDVETHFDIPQHWFIPFYENNAILEDCDMEDPLKTLFTNTPSFQGDIFKYAFCKNFHMYSDYQKKGCVEIFEKEKKRLEEVYQTELCFQYPNEPYMTVIKQEVEITQYIHQLYYFSKAFPKDIIQTLFEDKIQFYNTRVSEITAATETHKTLKINAFYNMGLACSNKGDKDKAIECYQKAIDIKPDEHKAFNNMGLAYADKGDKDKAIECYQKAIDIKPDEHKAFNNMGLAYADKGDKDKAIECYQKAIEIKPDYHEAFNNMGSAYVDKGDKDKAIECYQKAIDIKPDKHEAYYSMGYAYYCKGDKVNAIKCFEKVIEIEPNDSSSYNNIGYCLITMGNINEAEPKLLKAVELGCFDFSNRNLGHVYLSKNEEEKALQYYQTSLSHFEDKERFWAGMKDDYQYLAQYGVTEAYYQTILEKIS
jgi:Flp pilus assembly protein TadD